MSFHLSLSLIQFIEKKDEQGNVILECVMGEPSVGFVVDTHPDKELHKVRGMAFFFFIPRLDWVTICQML